MWRSPTHVETERFINMVLTVLNCLVCLKLWFITVNLYVVSVGAVVRGVEIVVVTVPPDPIIKTEPHLRRNKFISGHAAEVPFADITRCVASVFEDLSDTGFS